MTKNISTLKLFSVISLAAVVGLLFYGYSKTTPRRENGKNSQPKIEVAPEFFDFGEVEYGKVVEHSFTVKNSGSEILEIKRVSTSCGCTTAKVDKEKLSADEQGKLSVKFDTGAMGGSHGRGKQERIIYIKSNDPETPQVEVKIYANVY